MYHIYTARVTRSRDGIAVYAEIILVDDNGQYYRWKPAAMYYDLKPMSPFEAIDAKQEIVQENSGLYQQES